MKVKFNLPSKRHTNNFSFDNNTTLGIGNVQPLFCKSLVAGSKLSIGFNQLTRLSPLVVPTFARLKQSNDFCFVPMSMCMPSYDAFISNTSIYGSAKHYTPDSLPCITNSALFCSLLKHYSEVGVFDTTTKKWDLNSASTLVVKPSYYTAGKDLNLTFPSTQYTESQLPTDGFDFVLDNKAIFLTLGATKKMYIRLTQNGRYWYTVLRGLGYTCDPTDTNPVSILPLWAFARAYYDLYYPKRYNPWHASNFYNAINRHYNGYFNSTNVGGNTYDMVETWDCLTSLFGSLYTFDFFATIDDSLASAANSSPINYKNVAPDVNIDKLSSIYDGTTNPGSVGSDSGDGLTNIPVVNTSPNQGSTAIGADQISLANQLWSFVSKSSAVGQSVKDWLRVHFGVKPNDDMFDSTVLIEKVINDVSINTVVSTAQTSNGSSGDNLGALAGQGYASKHSRLSFEAKTFGFCFCLTSLVPISGVSTGTQPELYLNTYYEQPFPEFDGLGYEILNRTSFIESQRNIKNPILPGVLQAGFGFVPRLSSYKSLHNIRSGLFALNSTKDSFIPYCIDTIPTEVMTAGPVWRQPWSLQSNFVSFNRIFYNSEPAQGLFSKLPLDDNFMSQTSFDFSYTSYLKPLSDTYSIEQLGKDIISVKKQ